jgi:DNA repair protein RecN (Recombination protein N)
MSRFLLAFKSCFSQADAVGTMVFDEIDVGVSGRVAQAIAEKLHHLSQRHQVLCVTHQPLVAAMADHHFRVNKQVVDESATAKNGKTAAIAPTTDMPDTAANTATNTAANTAADDVRTVVRVEPLSTDQRREELALLAGGQSAQDAMPFADALLVQADTIRQARQNGSSANQSKVDPSKPDPSKPESTAAKSSSARSASTQSSTQPSAKSSAKSSTKSSAGKSGKARSQSKSKS